MAGLKWNTGKLYYSTVELGYQQTELLCVCQNRPKFFPAPFWSVDQKGD